MPAIGATLCTWTTLLLLCSLPISAQPANETVDTPSTTVHSSPPSSTSSIPPSTKSTPSARVSATSSPAQPSDSTCPYRTINYITHTLPQQCLRTSWSAPVPPTHSGTLEGHIEEVASGLGNILNNSALGEGSPGSQRGESATGVGQPEETSVADDAATAASTLPEPELEADSPFDNANFLSFEEWKKKNLARAGQSPENVGQGRAPSPEARNRRRPVNINALDALGEESEIEIDFSGFGHVGEGDDAVENLSPGTRSSEQSSKPADAEGSVVPTSFAISKDAGKTCKERFNYASFDCAATVLKTNSKVKGSSAVLVENKDSYMLNECSVDNKFVIVELCDDILVDTVVLANYEFFSSMFRHFRVSVSDRYPVKLDRWRVLGTFEARNSRDIQPFLITEPHIWARYLRIEFLTHFGNEFYCPVSLLRVHGTTMMEQFRREEEEARGDDDFAEPIEAAEGEPVNTAVAITAGGGDKDAEQQPIEPDKPVADSPNGQRHESTSADPMDPPSHSVDSVAPSEKTEGVLTDPGHIQPGTDGQRQKTSPEKPTTPTTVVQPQNDTTDGNDDTAYIGSHDRDKQSAPPSKNASSSSQVTPSESNVTKNVNSGGQDSRPPSKSSDETTNTPSGATSGKGGSNSSAGSPPPQARNPSPSQPNPASPTTQESFFKSIHKRLQHLEANSTLSLQYIEEQSRILRDAFMKVEKRQLAKTEKFLDHLNSTVMQELKAYRNMYDQLWQSTILELESMKERQKSEIGEIGTRLSMVADELVWQKRMAVVQSTLLLLCLGLVLFVRSGTLGSQSEIPIVQTLGSTYSRFFESPPGSPEPRSSVRRRRTFRNIWRSNTSASFSDGVTANSDTETYGRRSPLQVSFDASSPGSPSGFSDAAANGLNSSPPVQKENLRPLPSSRSSSFQRDSNDTSSDSDQAKRMQFLATQSGPATPNGTRDSRPSWEEVDRAVDQLIAEEQAQIQNEGITSPTSLPATATMSKKASATRLKIESGREKRKKRSPLRRAESYSYDDSAVGGVIADADDSPEDDGADGLFNVG